MWATSKNTSLWVFLVQLLVFLVRNVGIIRIELGPGIPSHGFGRGPRAAIGIEDHHWEECADVAVQLLDSAVQECPSTVVSAVQRCQRTLKTAPRGAEANAQLECI